MAGLVLAPVPWTSAMPLPGAFTVSISDTPSPTDPFLITFSTTVVPGAPTAYNWDFGDGQSWNGSGPGFASPVHRYGSPGPYLVSLVVFEGAESATQTLSLTVSSAALRAFISLNAESGASPFTATFTASIGGGSGTYPSVLWNFGDGGTGSGLVLSYTYRQPGSYLVVLNVTDSLGQSTASQTRVNVSSGPPGVVPDGTSAALAGVAVAAVGGTLAGVAVVGLWLGRRRTTTARGGGGDGAGATASGPDVGPTGGNGVGMPEPPRPSPGPILAKTPARPGPETDLASGEEPEAMVSIPATDVPVAPTAEALRLSQRIVLHLAGLGALGPDEVAPVGFTQLGMSQSLRARQNALTNVLRRLVAAEVLSEDVRHVRGQPRRLKIYRLTRRGEALGRELRRSTPRTGVAPRDAPAGDPPGS